MKQSSRFSNYKLVDLPEKSLWSKPSELISPDLLKGIDDICFNDDIFIIAHSMERDVPKHRHNFLELCFVIEGDVINYINNERLYMTEGTLCIMSPSSEHSLEVATQGSIIANICLRKTLFKEGVFKDFYLDDNIISRFLRGESSYSQLIFSDIDGHILGHGINALLFEYRNAGYKQDFIVTARVLMILAQALLIDTYSYYGINERMMQILDIININPAEASCASIAQEVGLSEAYLSQYVKKHMGRSLSGIIRDVRLERAAQLLASTDTPVDVIANTVGYSSYSHFHRVFVEKYGYTPGQNRNFAKRPPSASRK